MNFSFHTYFFQHNIFKNIGFWISLFFVIHLIGITNAPLDTHNWRQVTGLMVARNYYEVNSNILYPQVDDTGASGIIGMEFPFINYSHYLLSTLFGYADWYGRLITLLLTTIGYFFFYKIIKFYFSEKHAFYSTLCLMSSIWFAFSRKTMPDTTCISLAFIAIYYGFMYFEQGKIWRLLLYTFIISLAILTKIPAGIYLILFVPFLFKDYPFYRKLAFSIFTLIPLLLCFSWYFIWNHHLSETYGNWYNLGKPFLVGCKEIYDNFSIVVSRFGKNAFESYIAVLCFIFSLFFLIKRKEKSIGITFMLLLVIFAIYICKSGFFFYHHNYYIIPFVPAMTFLVGYFLSRIQNKKIQIGLVVLILCEGIINQQHELFPFTYKKNLYKVDLKTISDSVSNKSDLIAINGNGNPQQLYFAHRKGWSISNEQMLDEQFLFNLKQKNCKYLFINKEDLTDFPSQNIVYSDNHYVVLSLN